MFTTLILAFTTVAAPPGLELTFEYRDGPSVLVTLAFEGDQDGTTELSLEETWGGIENDGELVTEFAASSGGKSLASQRDAATSWVINHPPSAPIVATYVVPSTLGRGPLQRGNDYRTTMSANAFRMIGHLGLLIPAHVQGKDAMPINLTWNGFEAPGWSVCSSLGPVVDNRISASLTTNDLRHSVFLAGKLRLVARECRGQAIMIAIEGTDWGFTDNDFADLCLRIVDAQRAFWNDDSEPWFLVTLTPTGRDARGGSFSLGGTGLTDAFMLFCDRGFELTDRSPRAMPVKQLLAHEYFHTWNGGRIRSSDGGAGNYWFSEGFTDFYTRRMLELAGLATPADSLARLNESIAAFDSNPFRDRPLTSLGEEFWTDEHVQKLPYAAGDLIALAVDEEIRRTSSGRRSLDDLMRDMLKQSDAGEPFSLEGFLRLATTYTSPEFADSIRRSLERAEPIPLPQQLFRTQKTLRNSSVRHFEAGFDLDAARTRKIVQGVVDGSEAEKAGLRDGQRVVTMNVNSGGPGTPPSATLIVVDEDDEHGNHGDREITYEPLSAPTPIRKYQ